MTRMTSSELRKNISEATNRVAFGGERFVLLRGKKEVAALVPMDDLKLLQELEDAADLREIKRRKAKEGKNIPWKKVEAELKAKHGL